MCVKDKMMAHVALKRLMLGDECHAAISPDRTAIIYDIIKEAELDDSFATEIDFAFASAFQDGTAEDYSDLVTVFDDMPNEVFVALKKKGIL